MTTTKPMDHHAPHSPTEKTESSGERFVDENGRSLKDHLESLTLYNRMGGQTAILQLTHDFFEEIGKKEELGHFFENVPVQAIQLHQGKFFQVLFGPEQERPTPDELQDYMIATHVRLFRDKGLCGKHFDVVAECFVKALQKGPFSKDQIDECLAIVGPLRLAFDYGFQVAQREKQMDDKTKKTNGLPMATMETMRNQEPAVLPPGVTPPPLWLVDVVGGGNREMLRKWTCALTYRFTVSDKMLQETFMALPYLDMEPYLHIFLAIAFQDATAESKTNCREAISRERAMRFPLGIHRANLQVTKKVFQRMVYHFEQVGQELLLSEENDGDGSGKKLMAIAMKRLDSYKYSLNGAEPKSKIGSETAHRLKRDATDSTCTLSNDSASVNTFTSHGSGSKAGNRLDKKSSLRCHRKERQSNPIFGWLVSRRQAAVKSQ
jgi:truncated hemoglobin YjbI